jgi:hypothetical protein
MVKIEFIRGLVDLEFPVKLQEQLTFVTSDRIENVTCRICLVFYKSYHSIYVAKSEDEFSKA